jgi:Lrp/AsnC ligand binding domain/Winged helix-turn-helix DNA-binding
MGCWPQEDAGRTLRELGEAVRLSPSAVQRRLGRYQAAGLIARKVAVLDSRNVGSVLVAVVLVTLAQESTEYHNALRARLLAAPEVQQCYDVAGEWDYVVVYRSRHGELSRARFPPVPRRSKHQALRNASRLRVCQARPGHPDPRPGRSSEAIGIDRGHAMAAVATG